MFWFIHALLGGIIGTHFHSIFFIAVAALISHFILDMLPHWGIGFDIDYFKEFYEAKITKNIFFFALFDAFITLLLLFIFYHELHSKLFILGAFFSLLPDLVSLCYFTRIKNRKNYRRYLKFHSRIQKEADFMFGMLTQIVILIILLYVLL
ncbi:hypothetical protein A3K73_05990 [Candidatus Pacearchaeota archaeon RBG_13_36_9]|nr:MAG: hypothetical protein A3K73_05990 [Candidatus Pacearchaeota archaeon RBG_13_36_9]